MNLNITWPQNISKAFFLPNDLVHDKPLISIETDFRLPRMETASGQRSFSFHGAQVWNSLGKDLKGETSLGSLKKKTEQTVNVGGGGIQY